MKNKFVHAVQDIVSSLIVYTKASTEINGKRYMVKTTVCETGKTLQDAKGKQIKRQVVLMAMDVVKAEIIRRGRYIPCIVRVDYNYDLNQKGNITAAVEGWVRHITGTINLKC